MTPLILFSLAARRKLRERTTRASVNDPLALRTTMNDIERTLQVVFPVGRAAIVQDVYVSYRARDGEFILLVELTQADADDGLYVVKLGPRERLEKELAAWAECRPDGLRHDLVLTMLEERRDPATGALIALVYSDAEQFIGVDETQSLESALLDSTRLGVPTPLSVGDVLFYLYERLGLLLYRNSYTDDPATPQKTFTPARLDGRLDDNLTAYAVKSGPAFDIRALATTASFDAGLSDKFLDPFRFARHTIANPAAQVPRLRRGHAHGDLHGRNVLVGRVGDRVLWPTVFDYGDMGRDNLIGWDFVKLETELKLRAYPEIFVGPQQPFVANVIRLEHKVHELTERCRNDNRWPAAPERDEPLERLCWLVLMIRKHACQHLGLYCNRSREWLAEYYFLLAIYGLNGVRFDNLTHVQRLGGYLSAGCAASRYEWGR